MSTRIRMNNVQSVEVALSILRRVSFDKSFHIWKITTTMIFHASPEEIEEGLCTEEGAIEVVATVAEVQAP